MASSRNGIFGYVRFFRTHAGGGISLYLILSFIASYVDGFSFVLFLPLLSPNMASNNDVLSRLVLRVVHLFHAEPTPRGVVPLLLAFFVSKSALTFWLGVKQFDITARMTRIVRGKLVAALARAEYSYVQGLGPGYVSNLVNTEASRAVSACLYVSRLPPLALNVLVFSVIVGYLNPVIVAVSAICGCLAFAVLRIPGVLTERTSVLVSRDSAKLNGLLIELSQGYRYLRGTATFPPVEKHVSESVNTLTTWTRRIGILYSLTAALTQPLVVLFLGGLILFYDRAGRGIAPLLVVLMYLYRILTDLLTAQTWWQEARSYGGGIVVVEEALHALDAQRESRGHAPFSHLTRGLELADVHFSYGDRPAVRGVDLVIPRHASVAFVGESGSGKSTLVDLLCGTLQATTGVVRVDGVPLRELDPDSYRRRIGYVPQHCMLFEDTIANNITLWSHDASDKQALARIDEAARAAQCDEFIRALPAGYDTALTTRGENLSGGQRQRIAIARELYKQPDVLILDEATSALDAESEAVVRRTLQSLKGQVTLIIVTHRLASALDADEVYVLRDGKVVEHGAGAALLQANESWFRRMYDQQQQRIA